MLDLPDLYQNTQSVLVRRFEKIFWSPPDFRGENRFSPEPRLHRLVSVVVGLQEPIISLVVLHPGPALFPPVHHHEVLGILLAQSIAVPPLHHHAADHVRPL